MHGIEARWEREGVPWADLVRTMPTAKEDGIAEARMVHKPQGDPFISDKKCWKRAPDGYPRWDKTNNPPKPCPCQCARFVSPEQFVHHEKPGSPRLLKAGPPYGKR